MRRNNCQITQKEKAVFIFILAVLLLVYIETQALATSGRVYVVLTLDAEEKDDMLGIHGGILNSMLDIFEEEGLRGRVEILMPVDDWQAAVEDNLSVVDRIKAYPISLHCDRHESFAFQEKDKQKERIVSSIEWIKRNFPYSGLVFRAPSLREDETTRDVLSQVGMSYDLTPQIYASPGEGAFFPVLIRENLSLLPTSLLITGGSPEYSMKKAREINKFYFRSFDSIYRESQKDGPVVVVAVLHPTNWNRETLEILRENIRYMKSKPGVEFITASEIANYVPVLGKNPFDFSPKIGVIVEPREDYSRNKWSYSDESFLLYVLRSYGLIAERANPRNLEEYDVVVYYSPTGREPLFKAVVLDRGKLSGITPEALLDPRISGTKKSSELRCRLIGEIVDLKDFSLKALENAKALGETPYLKRALKAKNPCERLKFAYLSREYALQIASRKGKPWRYAIVDNSGIPKVYYGTVDGVYIGYQPAPHAIAQAAREAFYAYEKTGDREKLERGIFLVDYLLNISVDRGEYIVWEYSFPWPPYGLKKGWRSSLCQAGVLKALMLAYKHTGDDRYKQAAEKALRAFSVPVEKGGLLKLRQGYYWYPEYAKESPPYVLNGFITTLLWLREYAEYSNSTEAERLYQRGVEALIRFLPEYDANGWSYYDALGTRASRHYHALHVWQLGVMYNLTGEEIFKEYYTRWRGAGEKNINGITQRLSCMYKEEVVALHQLLSQIKSFLEEKIKCEECFASYNSCQTRYYHKEAKKEEHTQAILLLMEGFDRLFKGLK